MPADAIFAWRGGIKADNIARVAAAGADTLMAGSAIFNAKDYAGAIAEMRSRLKIRTRVPCPSGKSA